MTPIIVINVASSNPEMVEELEDAGYIVLEVLEVDHVVGYSPPAEPRRIDTSFIGFAIVCAALVIAAALR